MQLLSSHSHFMLLLLLFVYSCVGTPWPQGSFCRIVAVKAENLDETTYPIWRHDTYVKFTYDGQLHRTDIEYDNLNPIWNSPGLPDTPFPCGGKTSLTLTVDVFHKKSGPHLNLGTGTATINSGDGTFPQDAWSSYLIIERKGKVTTGRVFFKVEFAGSQVDSCKVIAVSAADLPRKDLFGTKSDAYAIAYINDKEIGRTKHISNNLDPSWDQEVIKNIPCSSAKFEMEVYDDDMFRDDFIGNTVFTISNGVPGLEYTRDIKDGSNKQGKITVRLETATHLESATSTADVVEIAEETEETEAESSGLSGGAIAGIVIGSICAAALLLVVAVVAVQKLQGSDDFYDQQP